MDKLIGQIVADRPTSLLFVSSVTPAKLFNANQNQVLQAYKTQIRDVIVPKYASLGDNVIFVDQYANFVDANGKIIHVSPNDNYHPDTVGYNLMYLSDVARPGEHIDRMVGGGHPAFTFRSSDFWVHGVTAGLELRY